MNGNASFNNNNLNTYTPSAGVGFLINKIKHTDGPDAVYSLLAIANANRSDIPDLDSPSKTVAISGFIIGSSQADLDSRIDTFKGYFIGKNKNLDITYGSGVRRYIATVPKDRIKIDRPDGTKKWAPFTIEFVCTEPFGLDTTPTSLFSVAGHTSASYTATPTVGGNVEGQLPIFTITINSLTGTGDYVQVSNDANNQALLIIGQGLANGDVLIIDCEQRIVTLNGDEIDYSGTFLELDPGTASITYSDGFTTRNVDIDAEYTKRWS